MSAQLTAQPKLKKEEFDGKFRFRESRKEGLVTCITCANMTGGRNDSEGSAFCHHPERFRQIKIAEYWGKCFREDGSHNLAANHVCDGYKSKPLPEGVVAPTLAKGQGILLGTQWRDAYHADPNCPYVLEELRIISTEEKAELPKRPGEIVFIDISEMVLGQSVRDMCDLPCCESKLQFQVYDPNGYRTHVRIHPNANDPQRFVKNGIVKHEQKVVISPEQAEAVFDLRKFNLPSVGDVYKRIAAVSEHLFKNTNRLGSRPLSGAVNHVWLACYFGRLQEEQVGANSGADVWMYDQRLFDWRARLDKPLAELAIIPEGIIPCIDTHGVFREAFRHSEGNLSPKFDVYGILKPVGDGSLRSKGLTHFVEIGAVSYRGYEHMWGEFGRGFSALASWHEE